MMPVVLVHGIKDDEAKMGRLARHLQKAGRTTFCVSLKPCWGQVGLDTLAEQLRGFVAAKVGQERFDLVGFSMGGLVARYYLQRLGGLAQVRRFVTISTPHQGTWMAYLIPNAGCRQMRPGSPFLQDLNRDAERLREVHFTSLWTPLDLTILPARSSQVACATDRRLWCLAHPLMVWQQSCLRIVAEALTDPPA